MRRFVFFLIMVFGIAGFAVACNNSQNVPTAMTDIYFADWRLNRLLPYECEIIDARSEDMARAVVKTIINGRDDDDRIKRVVPKIDDCVTVRLEDTVAYVDISSEIKDEMKHNRDDEKLFIYQLVNSLTSLKGVRFVKFTMDGAIHKDFLGFYDMRDTYKFTYPE